MANNITGAAADLILNAEPALYAQFHTADPTDAGTVAVAPGIARVPVTFGASSGGAGARYSSADVTTAASPGAITITHVSLWSAVTAGVCRWQGPLTTPVAVAAGQVIEVVTGDLSISLT